MTRPIQFLYVATILILAMAVSQVNSTVQTNIETTKKILNDYSNKGTKQLFKVYHYIFNKSYDYNTEAGIQKYKTFRANIQKIEEHNAKNLSYTKGINHLTDMTNEEVKKFYNLVPINPRFFAQNMRSLRGVSLDDYNDEEESINPSSGISNAQIGTRSDVDHREFMRPVKDQGNCGSCWAFATVAVIEGNFSKLNTLLTEGLSEQQLVDCDTANGGCYGGWYTNAMKFYYTHKAIKNAVYPYTGVQGTCAESGKTPENIQLKGYAYIQFITYRT
jgi:C1A family cysteine protease